MEVRRKKMISSGEEYRFMQEKIKRRPIGWKKIAGRIAIALGMGVLFGAAAGFTMEVLQPAFDGLTEKGREEDNLSLNVEQDEMEKDVIQESVGLKEQEESDGVNVTEELQRLESGIYQIAEKAKPFMVDVMSIMEELNWFEEGDAIENQSPGIIISSEEQILILTNRNAVKRGNYIRIRFCDGTIVQGREISYDISTNLSVIRVDYLPEETRAVIHEAQFKGEEISEGEFVIAVGQPLGKYDATLYGHIAGQAVKKYTDATYRRIYTDIAASSEGQGVLINSQAQVIGIINQNLAEDGGENLITALGTAEVQSLVEKLMRGEMPGYFGIEGETFSSEKAGGDDIGNGIYVTRVKKEFPAMAAGIQGGDILTEVNGKKIENMTEFQNEILKYAIGDKVSVTLMRLGRGEYKEMTFEVELGGY